MTFKYSSQHRWLPALLARAAQVNGYVYSNCWRNANEMHAAEEHKKVYLMSLNFYCFWSLLRTHFKRSHALWQTNSCPHWVWLPFDLAREAPEGYPYRGLERAYSRTATDLGQMSQLYPADKTRSLQDKTGPSLNSLLYWNPVCHSNLSSLLSGIIN